MTPRWRWPPPPRWSTPTRTATSCRTSAALDAFVAARGGGPGARARRGRAGPVPSLAPTAARAVARGRGRAVDDRERPAAEAKALPQLVQHDGWDYHLHATPPDAPLATRMAVEAAMAVVDVVRGDELSRLRVCDTRAATTCWSTCRRTGPSGSATPAAATAPPWPPTGPADHAERLVTSNGHQPRSTPRLTPRERHPDRPARGVVALRRLRPCVLGGAGGAYTAVAHRRARWS